MELSLPLLEYEGAPLREVERSWVESTRALREALNDFQAVGRGYQGTPLFETLAKYEEELCCYEQWHEALLRGLKKMFCFLPPFILNLRLRTTRELFSYPGRNVMEILESFFLRDENIRALEAEWAEDPLFEGRMEILSENLENHMAGRHASSIPIFLIHIDGVLQELLGVKEHGRFENSMKRLLGKSVTAEATFPDLDGIVLLPQIIREHIFLHTELTGSGVPYPSRHAILHGKDLTYYRVEHRSLRCLMFLDLLRAKELRPFSEYAKSMHRRNFMISVDPPVFEEGPRVRTWNLF